MITRLFFAAALLAAGIAHAQVTCQTSGNTTNCNGSLQSLPSVVPAAAVNSGADIAKNMLMLQQAALVQQQAQLARAQAEATRQQTVALQQQQQSEAQRQQTNTADQQPAITASNMARVCRGQDVRSYDNCVGVVVYPNGNIYSGEFRNGLRDGWGMIRVLAPGVASDHYIGSNVASTYVGQFANDRINGVGTWTTDTGTTVVGEYANNRLVKVLK